MRRFRFRLAPLLRLRSQFERTARRTLATAMGNLTAVEQRLAATDESLRQFGEHGRGADAAALLARALETGLARHRTRLQREQRAAAAQLDRARTDWTERRREQQTLLNLRDRRREEWRVAALQSEQRELEELAQLRTAVRAIEETS